MFTTHFKANKPRKWTDDMAFVAPVGPSIYHCRMLSIAVKMYKEHFGDEWVNLPAYAEEDAHRLYIEAAKVLLAVGLYRVYCSFIVFLSSWNRPITHSASGNGSERIRTAKSDGRLN